MNMPLSGERVLLIDDERELLATLAERMETRGLRVDTAESGEQAIAMIREKDFDAVVLDLAMPGIDGIETLRRILEINPDLQVILLTGHATVQKGVEAMKLGAVDLLEKPANFNELIAKIEEASTKKGELFEKRTEKKLGDIMRKKGW
jgi:DNA-binding NtrC family response regulator